MVELLVSLFLSACLGLWALVFAWNVPRDAMVRIAAGVVYFFTGSVLAIFLAIWFMATMLQYLLLLALMIYLMIRRPEKIQAARLIVSVSLAPYCLIIPLSVIHSIQHWAHVRERIPLVSLVDRLGKPPISLPDGSLNQEMEKDLVRLEVLLEMEASRQFSVEKFLRRVHEGTLLEFIESEGFGPSRHVRVSEYSLEQLVESRKGPFPQERPLFDSTHLDLTKLRKPLQTEKRLLGGFHETSVADFSFPQGFGFVKDQDHVAGFQRHRFGKRFREVEFSRQKDSHVDLVSLLLHDSPVVYQSDELPRMDQARSMPTRPLNLFESASLERIKKGENLIVAEFPEGWLMMGSIRNAQQCVKCHGGKRGDLLGAFAYSIPKIEAVRAYRETIAR